MQQVQLQEWYKDSNYKKQQVQELLREKEKQDHLNFINHVDRNYHNSRKEYADNVIKHVQYREFKNAVGFVPVNEREVLKNKTIEQMKQDA